MTTPNELSETQVRILECVRDYLMRRHMVPTTREIMEATGVTSSSVISYNLKQMERAGYVRRAEGKARALRLTEKANPLTDLRALLEDHTENLELLAAEVYEMDRDTLHQALTARAEGLRAALATAGATL